MWQAVCGWQFVLLLLFCYFLGGNNSTQSLCHERFVITAYPVTQFTLAYMSETAAAARLACSKALNSVWLIHLEASTTSFYPSVFVLLCEKAKYWMPGASGAKHSPTYLSFSSPSGSFQGTGLFIFYTLLVMTVESLGIDLTSKNESFHPH